MAIMISWDLVFWENKKSVDYVPTCWAVDEYTYKWPQGVSRELHQSLIDTCDPLNNVRFKSWRRIAKRKNIMDLQKAKSLCEKALYTSSVETTDVEEILQTNSESSSDNENFMQLKKNDEYKNSQMDVETTCNAFTPPIPSCSKESPLRRKEVFLPSCNKRKRSGLSEIVNNNISSSGDEDLETLKQLSYKTSHESGKVLTPSHEKNRSLCVNDPPNTTLTVKKMKKIGLNNPVVDLPTNRDQPIQLTASEKIILKEIKKMSWEIADLKKTNNKIYDLVLVNSINIENLSVESWQLPIDTQESLESLEQFLGDGKNVGMLGQRFYLCCGETYHKAVFLIMKKLFSREISMQFSGTGKKGKKAFQKLKVYTVVKDAIRKRFPSATDADINKSISLYLAGASDRQGGRKTR